MYLREPDHRWRFDPNGWLHDMDAPEGSRTKAVSGGTILTRLRMAGVVTTIEPSPY